MVNKEFSLEEEAYLLQVIKGDGNLEPLTGKHSYIDISDEINNLIRAGYAELNKESLKITEKGIERLKNTHRSLKRKKDGWIEPKIDEKIEKIGKNDIYLPRNLKRLTRRNTHQQ